MRLQASSCCTHELATYNTQTTMERLRSGVSSRCRACIHPSHCASEALAQLQCLRTPMHAICSRSHLACGHCLSAVVHIESVQLSRGNCLKLVARTADLLCAYMQSGSDCNAAQPLHMCDVGGNMAHNRKASDTAASTCMPCGDKLSLRAAA